MSSNLRQRVLSALCLLPVIIAAIAWLPNGGIALLLGAVTLLGAWEWGQLAFGPQHLKRALFVLVTAALMALTWAVAWPEPQVGRAGAQSVITGAGAWWLIATACLLAVQAGHAMAVFDRASMRMAAGWLTLVPGWLAMVMLHREASGGGPLLLLSLMLLVWSADVGAYFAGRRFGGPKLASRISPGKTWSGFLGGLLAALLMALALAALAGGGRALWLFVAIALLAVVGSVVGDLFESLMKRRANIKDSGSLIPGHGGVLDRIDSLTAAAPVFALMLDITAQHGAALS